MIKYFSFLNINFVFSILGIYTSYFIFGLHHYMYPRFEIYQIFFSSFRLVTVIFFILSIVIFIFNKINNSYLKKIFEYLLFSISFYFLFHFIIRFVDLNFYQIYSSIFSIDNNFVKILFYGLPLFLGFGINFFSKKKINNIKKFIFIFLIILNCLLFLRLFDLYSKENQFSPKNDFKNLIIKENQNKNKKIFLIIFDEFDYAYLSQELELLPNLKKLYNSSYVNNNFFSPAEFTIDSLPSILTGSSFKDKIINKGILSVITDENKKVDFNFKNSIFNMKKNNLELTASIYGDVHPYCKFLRVENCYDRFQFQKEDLNFLKSIEIFFHISYLDKILPIKSFFRKYFKIKSSMFDNFKLVPIGFGNGIDKVMFENTEKFINSDTDIIFIHYPFPKLNNRFHAESLVKIIEENKKLNIYQKNLFIVDETIRKIMSNIENYNGSLIIITTDHWLRDKKFKINDEKKIVFMSKIIGDDNFYDDVNKNYSKNIKNLIIEYNNDMIKSNNHIKKFFVENNE